MTTNLITQNLVENKEGIYLASHSKKIWEGNKDLIIRSKFYKNEVNKLLYLLEDDLCYGIIKLKQPYKINFKEFKNLENRHTITDEERKKWWPHKEVLFAYSFSKVIMFEEPKDIKIPHGSSGTFVKEFEFLNSEEELIKDIASYNPLKANNLQLVDDFNIAMSWYSTKKSGGYIKHSIEDIKNLSSTIYEEIKKRIEGKKMDYDFKSVAFTPLTRELFESVSKTIICNSQVLNTDFISVIVKSFGHKQIKNFSKVDDAVKYMFDNSSKYALEKKYGGYECILIKEGSKIKIFSNTNMDITKKFKTVVAQASQLSQKSLILHGELVYNNNGKSDIENYILGKHKLNDTKINLQVYDLSYFDEDITDKLWNERKQLLHSLNFTNNIKEVHSILIDDKESAKKAINLLSNIKGSDGAIIKNHMGKYNEEIIRVLKKQETTTESTKEVLGEEQGIKVEGPDKQGEEVKDFKEWDKKDEVKTENADTTQNTPGIPAVQGKEIGSEKKKKIIKKMNREQLICLEEN